MFDGEPSDIETIPVEREALAALADGELGAMLDARCAIVTSLVAEITNVVSAAGPTRVIAMDMSGAAVGYATGMPTGDPAPMRAWEDGLDLPAVAVACHGIAVLAYARDVARIRADFDAYARLLPAGVSLTVGVRPMPPDCHSAAEMAPKVALLRERGVASMEVSHHGSMWLHHLDWVREAVRNGTG